MSLLLSIQYRLIRECPIDERTSLGGGVGEWAADQPMACRWWSLPLLSRSAVPYRTVTNTPTGSDCR